MRTLQEPRARSATGGGLGAPAVSAFRTAMGSYPTGVAVVTVATGDGSRYGVTVNSFSSVSLDPMLVLVCLSENSRGIGLIERAAAFAVNVLSAGQRDVSRWFANPNRPAGSLMFDGVPFEPGMTGCPVLVGATASFECRLRQAYQGGDHLIVLGQVVALIHRAELEPLIFHDGTYTSPGQCARRFSSVDDVAGELPHDHVRRGGGAVGEDGPTLAKAPRAREPAAGVLPPFVRPKNNDAAGRGRADQPRARGGGGSWSDNEACTNRALCWTGPRLGRWR